MQDSSPNPEPPTADSQSGREEKTAEVVRAPKRPGFLKSYFGRARAIIFSPREFFADMPTDSTGLLRPDLFLLITASIYAFLQAVAKLSPMILVTAVPSSIISVLVASAIISFACKKLGGIVDFKTAFKILAYSKATLLFAWISLGAFPIGGIISMLYGVYLNIVGLLAVEKIGRWKIISLLVTLTFIGFIVKKVTGF